MIPLILYGESPKNPTAGTKAELDRPGTPSYRRYFIYRTKTASPSAPSSSACPLDSLARSKGGIRINIRRWRMKLQPALSAVFLSSSFPFSLLLLLLVAAPPDDASPARKQMSDDHPVHSEAQWETSTTWNDSMPRHLTYWITRRLLFKTAPSIWLPIFMQRGCTFLPITPIIFLWNFFLTLTSNFISYRKI